MGATLYYVCNWTLICIAISLAYWHHVLVLSAGNSLRQNLRRAGFAFFGIFNGTEFNPHFFEEVEKAVDRQKGAVLVCGIGGILEPLGRGGRQSRSAACHLAPDSADVTFICKSQP